MFSLNHNSTFIEYIVQWLGDELASAQIQQLPGVLVCVWTGILCSR